MSRPAIILIVEDKQSEREALARMLRLEGYDIIAAADPQEALSHLGEDVDLVISDLRMGTSSGVDLLRYWKQQDPSTPIIMVTAYGEVGSAVEAMKLGAEDYLAKPVNPDELLILVEKCIERRRKDRRLADLESRLDERLGFEKIVGDAPPMRQLFDQARRAARVDSTVLITGESGTGKELIAEAVHHNSPRKSKPFVTVNMAAVPEHLVESELFGHIKGAFTGAMASRIGRFEAADQGTLFIDEIGDFKLESQAKLLRALENQTITPIGSNDDKQVDVRVVAATSRNLEEMVEEQKFREDLYYRLNVISLHIPPLRSRAGDIPLMVDHFLIRTCARIGVERRHVAPELLQFLRDYEWPGNVRQLRNCIESMVALSSGETLTTRDLPPSICDAPVHAGDVDIPSGTTLQELERTAVEQALAEHDGNRTRAAEALGISVRTLQRKLKAWGGAEDDDDEADE